MTSPANTNRYGHGSGCVCPVCKTTTSSASPADTIREALIRKVYRHHEADALAALEDMQQRQAEQEREIETLRTRLAQVRNDPDDVFGAAGMMGG